MKAPGRRCTRRRPPRRRRRSARPHRAPARSERATPRYALARSNTWREAANLDRALMSIKTSQGCFRTLDPEAVDSGANTAPQFFHAQPSEASAMNRRQLILSSTAFGLAPLAAAVDSVHTLPPGAARPAPATGSIPVAFLLSDGAVFIDFCGPWEVFESVNVTGRRDAAFRLYTVAETTAPITASSGMKIVPNYTFKSAPAPKVVVIPAQRAAGDAALDWIRQVTRHTDVTMAVCTGAYVLARTGLLSGQPATTHHGSYSDFAMQFPDVRMVRGARFVEAGNLATAGGLSSGID